MFYCFYRFWIWQWIKHLRTKCWHSIRITIGSFFNFGVLSLKLKLKLCIHWSLMKDCLKLILPASTKKGLPFSTDQGLKHLLQTTDLAEKHTSTCFKEFLSSLRQHKYLHLLFRCHQKTTDAHFIKHFAKRQFNVVQLF